MDTLENTKLHPRWRGFPTPPIHNVQVIVDFTIKCVYKDRRINYENANFYGGISQEDDWFIAQCLEVDVSSQGKSEDEAVDNLREALELYLEPPRPTVMPKLRKFQVNIGCTTRV